MVACADGVAVGLAAAVAGHFTKWPLESLQDLAKAVPETLIKAAAATTASIFFITDSPRSNHSESPGQANRNSLSNNPLSHIRFANEEQSRLEIDWSGLIQPHWLVASARSAAKLAAHDAHVALIYSEERIENIANDWDRAD